MPFAEYLQPLLRGAEITAEIAAASMVLGAILAFAAGLARTSAPWPFRAAAVCYVEIFRGTSLLVQLFWLFYALPLLGVSFTPIVTGILGLGLNIGAYGAEVVRGAVLAVPRDQHEAARALNLPPARTLRRIVLPQALPEMMPPFGNLAIQNLKDTALVSMITIGDLTFRAQQLRNITLDSIPIYTLTLLLYFAMALALMALMRRLERLVAHDRVARRAPA